MLKMCRGLVLAGQTDGSFPGRSRFLDGWGVCEGQLRWFRDGLGTGWGRLGVLWGETFSGQSRY